MKITGYVLFFAGIILMLKGLDYDSTAYYLVASEVLIGLSVFLLLKSELGNDKDGKKKDSVQLKSSSPPVAAHPTVKPENDGKKAENENLQKAQDEKEKQQSS